MKLSLNLKINDIMLILAYCKIRTMTDIDLKTLDQPNVQTYCQCLDDRPKSCCIKVPTNCAGV